MNDIEREALLGSLDYLAASVPEHADIIRAAINLISEDGLTLATLADKVRAEAIDGIIERAERYYTAQKGRTYACLVSYNLRQFANDMLKGEKRDEGC